MVYIKKSTNFLFFRVEKERQEIERNRHLTEEERRADQRMNNKVITNKPAKGRYKFLQKYYHRGVFFMVSILYMEWKNALISS